ncbi:MAG: heavy metal translocating P-type ATPase, partial [Thermoprotei archaeon]
MEHKTKIKIIGIDCLTCVYAIERRLKSLGCVRAFKTEISSGIAEIEFDKDVCVLRDVYEAIRDAGYDVYKEKIYVDLRGFSGEETHALESRILRKTGVLDVRISHSSGVMTVLYNPLETTREIIAKELSTFGLRLLEEVTKETSTFSEKHYLYRRLGSFATGLLAVALSTYSMFTGDTLFSRGDAEKVLLLFAVIAIVLNYDIVVRGLKSLIRAIPVMDSLIAISSISTLTAGVALITGFLHTYGNLHASSFFEASAGVIGFVGLGKYLEERLRKRAFKSLEKLAASLRSSVRVVSDKSVTEKPVAEVKMGEIVEVRAGEVIPVDGIVVEGLGYVDESSFTGEPVPHLKKGENRDPVLAGSLLQSGYLRVRATRVGSETLVAYVIETVREVESLKPRLARLADKIVGYFTWVVIAIALVTLVYWSFIAKNPQLGVMFKATVLTV